MEGCALQVIIVLYCIVLSCRDALVMSWFQRKMVKITWIVDFYQFYNLSISVRAQHIHAINKFNENTIYCTHISELSANPGAKISYKVSVWPLIGRCTCIWWANARHGLRGSGGIRDGGLEGIKSSSLVARGVNLAILQLQCFFAVLCSVP